ncbi:MAG: membrane dipeptidase, partial [Rhodothermales bacterium]|nr:membrane dipeptidase [Rhodothermales bacterium]
MPQALTPKTLEDAQRLAERTIIIDGHIDVPYWVDSIFEEDVAEETIGGDFDYPRAVRGGLDAAFMAIYVPATFQTAGGAKRHADHLIDVVEGIIQRAPAKFAPAGSADEIRANHDAGLVS